jgi:hypothetical protein
MIELKGKGLSYSQVAKVLGCSKANVVLRIQGLPSEDEVSEYKENRADLYAGYQNQILQIHLTPDRIKKMPPSIAPLWFNSLFNNERLQRDLSTSNMAVNSQVNQSDSTLDKLSNIIQKLGISDFTSPAAVGCAEVPIVNNSALMISGTCKDESLHNNGYQSLDNTTPDHTTRLMQQVIEAAGIEVKRAPDRPAGLKNGKVAGNGRLAGRGGPLSETVAVKVTTRSRQKNNKRHPFWLCSCGKEVSNFLKICRYCHKERQRG